MPKIYQELLNLIQKVHKILVLAPDGEPLAMQYKIIHDVQLLGGVGGRGCVTIP